MKAIISGTFDPFTLGHRDLVVRALGIYGAVIVAVAKQTGKNTADAATRVDIAKKSLEGLENVDIVEFDGLLSDYVKSVGDCVIVRGLRGTRDLEYERDLDRAYKKLCGAETVYFLSPPELEHVTSTAVRTLAGLNAPIDDYVAAGAVRSIRKVYGTEIADKEM